MEMFFHDIAEDETCSEDIYATSGGAAICATVRNLDVFVLDD